MVCRALLLLDLLLPFEAILELLRSAVEISSTFQSFDERWRRPGASKFVFEIKTKLRCRDAWLSSFGR